MTTFGWVLIGVAFLMLIMVANNSWSFVWTKILGGTTGATTQTNPTPQTNQNQTPNIVTPPTQLVPTVNGVVQSNSGNTATA